MPTSDHLLRRPWLELVVHGARRGFSWPPVFLRRLRTRFSILYWNPTPGAAVTVDGRRHLLDRRHALLIPAGAWFQRENIIPFDHWWCHLRVRGDMAEGGVVPVAGELATHLRMAWDGCWDPGPGAPGTLAAAHAAVAIALTRAGWRTAAADLGDIRLMALERWLEGRGYPPAGNDELAGRIGMHAKAFSRLFRHAAGCTAQEWLRRRRLDLAAERLEQGMSVEQAAAAGGFADRYHFGRLFRRHHGVGPGGYRRSHIAPD